MDSVPGTGHHGLNVGTTSLRDMVCGFGGIFLLFLSTSPSTQSVLGARP
jgi:hypothetical protein